MLPMQTKRIPVFSFLSMVLLHFSRADKGSDNTKSAPCNSNSCSMVSGKRQGRPNLISERLCTDQAGSDIDG